MLKRGLRLGVGVLVCLLLGAHSLRIGQWGLTAAFLVMAGLLFTRQAWVKPAFIAACFWGVYTWLATTLELFHFRLILDQPWGRLLIIMGTVCALTALCAMIYLLPAANRDFDKNRDKQWGLGAVFILTVALLALIRAQSPFVILLADRFQPGAGWLEIMFLGLYAVFAADKLFNLEKSRIWRPRFWAFFSLVFFGQLALGLIGVEKMLMTGELHLPVPAMIAAGPVFRGQGLFMPILFTVTVLLVGPAWCSHLCYIGAWDDGFSRLAGKPRTVLPRWLSWLRLAVFALVVITAFLLRWYGVSTILAVALAIIFGLAGVLIMAIASSRLGVMVHCSSYCPMGIAANILGRLSPWRLRISKDCNLCGICSRSCRYSALGQADLKRARPGHNCTLCGDCLAACPHSHIRMTFPGISSKIARQSFVVLVVMLHTVFLGIARI